MFHIFIKTPLYRNSNYVPHIIEHSVIPYSNTPSKYFQNKIITGENYIYYTNFVLRTNSQEKLQDFISHIQKPLQNKRVSYEKKVIRDELALRPYQKKVMSNIGTKLYNEHIKYSQTHRVNLDEIASYHNKYYTPNNIIVLERDKLCRDISMQNYIYNYKHSFELNSVDGKEKVYIFDYNIQNLFITTLLSELYDNYIQYYNRYHLAVYYSNETFIGEYENAIFLSIAKDKELELVQNVPGEFISQFIENKLKYFSEIDYSELDGVSMMQFGYTLGDTSKMKIIKNMSAFINSINI